MYYPYLRGKQFELIAVRENAGRMSNLVIPVIEPVRSSMNSLRRALEALIEEEASFIVVANPTVGELKARHELLREELTRDYLHEYANWSVGWIAGEDTTEDDILSAFDIHGSVAIIHGGYRSGAKLADILSRTPAVALHVFLEGETSKLYRHHFADETRILIRDGFKAQRRNIDYPDVSHFSDLHITFRRLLTRARIATCLWRTSSQSPMRRKWIRRASGKKLWRSSLTRWQAPIRRCSTRMPLKSSFSCTRVDTTRGSGMQRRYRCSITSS